MKILHKYVLKEHIGPLIFALATLTSLLLLNYIAKKFGDLVGKGLPWTAIAEFFGLSVPFTMALTFPMAVLVATLYAFGRLASENEITALKASGVSLRAVLTPVLVAAFFLTLFMVVFNDQIMPRANHQLAVLQTNIAQKKPTFALREQVINEVQPGRLYLRANHIDEASNRMREVTIYDMGDPTRRRTIYADSGDLAMAKNRTDLLMTLYHGTMQDVMVQKPEQLQRLYFNVDLIVVKGVANSFQQNGGDQTKGQREMTACEMQQEVDQEMTGYLISRQLFLQNLEMTRAAGKKVSKDMLLADTSMPSQRSLGGMYCSFLRTIGLKTLGGDTTARHDSVVKANAQEAAMQRAASRRVTAQRAAALRADSQRVKMQHADSQHAASQHAAVGRLQTQQTVPPQVESAGQNAGAAASESTKVKAAKPPVVPPAKEPIAVPGPSEVQGLITARHVDSAVALSNASRKPQTPAPPHTPSPASPVPASPAPTPVRPAPPPPNSPSPAMLDQTQSFPGIQNGALEADQYQMVTKRLSIANYEVEIHKKFALAVACFVFVLLGAPIALRFPRGGVGLTIGVSLFVFALYYVGLIAGASLATRGLIPAWVAMWGANVVFTLVALYLLSRMGKEGNTARGGDAREMLENVKLWIRRRLRGGTSNEHTPA